MRGCGAGERQVNEPFPRHEYINERARCHAAMSSEQLKSVGRIRGYRLVKWFSKIENCKEFQTDQTKRLICELLPNISWLVFLVVNASMSAIGWSLLHS